MKELRNVLGRLNKAELKKVLLEVFDKRLKSSALKIDYVDMLELIIVSRIQKDHMKSTLFSPPGPVEVPSYLPEVNVNPNLGLHDNDNDDGSCSGTNVCGCPKPARQVQEPSPPGAAMLGGIPVPQPLSLKKKGLVERFLNKLGLEVIEK